MPLHTAALLGHRVQSLMQKNMHNLSICQKSSSSRTEQIENNGHVSGTLAGAYDSYHKLLRLPGRCSCFFLVLRLPDISVGSYYY